eukprot:TRINITY_DN1647_c0_g1_i1.p1 TRINITY_DN1647_c0_g1~~TRINITY_DN1647_c0_g1_i1.p1  ORF type:complete len:858 (-),score=208.66 TRINITY_DN1647_c0_g1_i1:38-2611(-)
MSSFGQTAVHPSGLDLTVSSQPIRGRRTERSSTRQSESIKAKATGSSSPPREERQIEESLERTRRSVHISPAPPRTFEGRADLLYRFTEVENELKREKAVSKLLQSKIHKLREELDLFYTQERESLIEHYEKRLAELKAEMSAGRSSEYAVLEREVRRLREENIRLARTAPVGEEADRWKTRFVMSAMEIERLIKVLTQLSAENEQWQIRYKTLEGIQMRSEQTLILEEQLRSSELKIRDAEEQIGLLVKDNQRLTKEIERISRAPAEEDRRSHPVGLEQRFVMICFELERMISLLVSKDNKIEEMVEKYNALEAKLEDTEARCRMNFEERERLLAISSDSESRGRLNFEERDRLLAKLADAEARGRLNFEERERLLAKLADAEARGRLNFEERDRLASVLDARSHEVDELRSRLEREQSSSRIGKDRENQISSLTKQLEELMRENDQLHRQAAQYEEAVASIGPMKESYSLMIKGFRNRLDQATLARLLLGAEVDRLGNENRRLGMMTEELVQLRKALEESERELEVLRPLEREFDQMEVQMRRIAAERDSAEADRRKLQGMVDELETRLAKTSAELEQREEEWRSRVETLRRSTIDGSDLSVRFNAERSSLEAAIMQLRQRISELESRLALMQGENERLSGLLSAREKDIEKLRERNGQLEGGHFQELEELRVQLEVYKRGNVDARELSLRFGGEKAQLESQLRQLRSHVESAETELSRQIELVSTVRADNDRLRNENDILRRDNYGLNSTKTEQEIEMGRLRDQLATLEREYEQSLRTQDVYRNQVEGRGNEMQRKNQELMVKLQDLEQLQRRYEDAIRSTREVSLTPSRESTTNMITRTYTCLLYTSPSPRDS